MYTRSAYRTPSPWKQRLRLILLLCLFLCQNLPLPVQAQSRATTGLGNVVKRTSQTADELVEQGATLLDEGAYAEAIAAFDQALTIDADHARAYALRGQAYWLLNELDQALTDLNRAIELADDDADAYSTRGAVYADLGQYPEALADYTTALDLAPNNTWTLAHRGYTAYLANDHEAALTDLNQALRLNPQYIWAIVARGTTYKEMAEYKKALLDLTRAVSLDADYDWALAMRGSTYRALGEYDKAIADLTRALTLTPAYHWAQIERGWSYQEMGDQEKALTDFDAVIEQDPTNDWAYVRRGMLYYDGEEYESALADFNEALTINPEYDWALAQRGQIYQAQEAYEEALADFTAAIAIDPTYGWYYALRADLLRITERYEEALEDANQAVELAPDDEFAWGVRGYVYRMMEQYEEAVADFTHAIELEPTYGWAYTMRGELYQLLGQEQEALADFEQADQRNGTPLNSTPVPTVTPLPTATSEAAPSLGALLTNSETQEKPTGAAAYTLADAQQAVIQIEAVGSFSSPTEAGPTVHAGSGSGFIIDPSGLAVTNNHVVTGGALFQIYVAGQSKALNARVLGVSECADLAVIDIEGDGFPYLRWYDGDIAVGLDVYAAGYPLGDPEYTLTRGIIAKARANGQTAWSSLDYVLQHDADINPGNSGGPLLTSDGQVVGINYAVNAQFRQFFAISSAEARPIIEQLRLGQDVDALGVNGEAFINDAGFHGIWISSVQSGSPAEQAGIQGGDILLSLENIGMAGDGTMQAYCEVVRSHSATDTLNFELLRPTTSELCTGQLNGRELTCQVVDLQSAPAASEATAAEGDEATTPNPEEAVKWQTVTHDSGLFTLNVPAEWTKQESTTAGNRQGLLVQSETDSTVGVFSLYVTQADPQAADSSLDKLRQGLEKDAAALLDSCTYADRKPFTSQKFQGAFEYWTDCGTEQNQIFTLTMWPLDRQAYYLEAIIRWNPAWTATAIEQMLDSLTVTDLATVLVRSNILNVRNGPGTNYGAVGQLQEGTRLLVLAQAYNCAWLQVELGDGKLGWIAGQPPYATLEGDCTAIPKAQVSSAPTGGSSGNGCILFQNSFNDEATVTLTSKDGKWNKTFKIGRKANHRECLPPGTYTYTVDIPPPWGSINGELEISRGRTISLPIHS